MSGENSQRPDEPNALPNRFSPGGLSLCQTRQALGDRVCQECCLRDITLEQIAEQWAPSARTITPLCLSDGDVLYEEGAAGAHVMSIRSGVIKLIQMLPDGEPRIVRVLAHRDAAGLEILCHKTYQHTAIAMGDVSACRIPATFLEHVCKACPDIYIRLMNRWETNLERADQWITEFSTGPVVARIARLVRFLHGLESEPEANTVTLPNRTDLAAMLGVTHETACRQISELQKNGTLSAVQGNCFRFDPDAVDRLRHG